MPSHLHAELPAFEVIAGDPASPVIMHAPHAATRIPAWVRERILLDDRALALELGRMTDASTDLIAERVASEAAGRGALRPWRLVNRLSRLVVDPERFPDEREQLNDRGMGAVYTSTSHGEPLRDDDTEHRQQLIDRYFTPYAETMTSLVDQRLHAAGRAVILDIHSYPVHPLPFELYPQARRPQICLGVDEFHTPDDLVGAAMRAFAGWEVAVNEPFVGCYVPLKHYQRDRRVSSVMIEIRRDIIEHPRLPTSLAALARAAAR